MLDSGDSLGECVDILYVNPEIAWPNLAVSRLLRQIVKL